MHEHNTHKHIKSAKNRPKKSSALFRPVTAQGVWLSADSLRNIGSWSYKITHLLLILLPSARDISEHQLTVSHLEFVWSHLINLTFTLYEPCQRHYAGQITNFTPIPNQGNCSVVPIRISIKGCIGYSAPSVPYQCLIKIEENLIITIRSEYILFTLLYLRFALW